jgi:lipid-A-disaccharide synthase
MSAPLRIFLLVGEPSGDQLGAHIMAAIRKRAALNGQTVEFSGLGGETMAEQGLDSLFPISDLAIFGLIEVIPHAPRIFRRVRETVAAIRAFKPDVVLSIDVPAFAFRVLKQLKYDNVPLVHCVAPTVWAWRPRRAKMIADFLDHLLVLLPFEPPYFERVGLASTFIGHPIVEAGLDRIDGAVFRAKHGIAPDEDLLCVLPGSRRSEVSRLLPIFGETLKLLAPKLPKLRIVVPTVAHVADTVRAAAATWPLPAIVVTGNEEKFAAFKAAKAALAASGTVVLELAVAGCPTVMAYQVSGVTAWIVRRLVKVQYASLPNLILNQGLIPEYLQEHCNPAELASAVGRLLLDDAARRTQIEGGAEVARRLGLGGPSPSEMAAGVVLDYAAKHQMGERA